MHVVVKPFHEQRGVLRNIPRGCLKNLSQGLSICWGLKIPWKPLILLLGAGCAAEIFNVVLEYAFFPVFVLKYHQEKNVCLKSSQFLELSTFLQGWNLKILGF